MSKKSKKIKQLFKDGLIKTDVTELIEALIEKKDVQ